MGKFIKNAGIKTGSYAIRMPVGTNSLAPNYPEHGQMRYNFENLALELYSENSWNKISFAGQVSVIKEYFTGNDVQTNFEMSQAHQPGSEANILVFIGGIYQDPSIAYTVNGTTLTFTSPPANLIKIVVLHNFNSTQI